MDIVIIAHFITEFVKDGTSRFVCIAEELSKSNDVELITSRFDHIKKKPREEENFDLDTKVTLIEEPSYTRNVCLKRLVSHANFGKQVKKYLQSRKKPDVIYCAIPSIDCAYYAAQYAYKNNVKFIIDIQDLWPEAFRMAFNVPIISNMLFSPMQKKVNFVYSNADKIVGVSNTYCERAKGVNIKNAEIIPVYLGVNLEEFDRHALENQVSRSSDRFIIGYCGTLGHSYDIKCVLDSMIELKHCGYDNVEFWVMGDGPLKRDFELYAKKNALNVIFYGRVPYEKMCGLLCACDACINPIVGSSVASIINKHGDYAASGLPVINTQESKEYKALIDRFKCGINCENSNHIDLANAIMSLIRNKRERIEMGKQARKMAEELFDRNANYFKIYNAIL